LETKIEELDLIVFPMDAKFEAAQGKNNTYVLKFETDTDKHYFWMQVFFTLIEGKSVS
jgi:hypothetical protein